MINNFRAEIAKDVLVALLHRECIEPKAAAALAMDYAVELYREIQRCHREDIAALQSTCPPGVTII